MAKKVIAVVGATGAQGGGLVRAICHDKTSEFTARALTRNVNSDKAKQLAALGAEVVEVDVDNEDSVRKAFEGAYGAFCVTFFWDHFSPEKEVAQARAQAQAAKAAGVQHAIWSTLEDTRKFIPLSDTRMPTLMGKYKVPHLDSKGESDHFFTDLGVPTTFLLTSYYWDNAIGFGMGPKRGPDGKLVFAMPMGDAKLVGIAAEDIGKCAYGIFRRGEQLIGTTTGVAGEKLTGAEMAAKFGRAFGEVVTYQAVPFDVYRGLGFPGAGDLGNMFQFFHDYADEVSAARDVQSSRALNPQLQNFDQWLTENKARIPLN